MSDDAAWAARIENASRWISHDSLRELNSGQYVIVPRSLIESYADDVECRLDHHGYCQEHNWFAEGECGNPQLKRLLGL